MARQPVKVTYAHKRGRAKAAAKLLSSPLEALPPDRDDITRSEMSRRMLKRSRGIAREDDDTVRLKGRVVKRSRQTVESDALEAEADINTFQTPFPSAEYVHPSSVTRPLAPEEFSPVPNAKRILSRTSSRNLKENSTSLPLASPFHSRPSSPHADSTIKSKLRSSRIPLHLKSRTLSGAFQKTDSAYTRRKLSHKDSTISLNDRKLSRKDSTMSLNYTRLSRKDSTLSLNEPARYSPSKHQRRPSSPDPSYMLSHIAQQDWISPSKPLTIRAGICEPDPESIVRPNPIQNLSASPFLVDRAQFFSTPPHSRSGSKTGLLAPESPSKLAFLAPSPCLARDEDFEMADHTEHRKIRISGNSIISSSGSFTLRSHQIPNAPDVGDDHIDSAGSAPMSMSLDELPQKISLGEYMIPLGSSPPPASDLANSGPRHTVSMGQHALALSGSSPPVPPAPASPVVAIHTAIGQQLTFSHGSSSPAPECPGSAARNARYVHALGGSTSLPDRDAVDINSFMLVTSAIYFNVVTLAQMTLSQAPIFQICLIFCPILNLFVSTDRHDNAGAHGTQFPMRTRSLESPAGISSKKTNATKHKRNRAGTIRASDFAQPAPSGASGSKLTSLASTIAGPAGSLPGRTRSGTVVGPNSKLAIRPHSKGAMRKQPMMQLTRCDAHSRSEDDMNILKVNENVGPWSTEDLDYVGLAQRVKDKRGRKKFVHDDIMSDDPLLISGPWRDEDWS
ncbi:hypothetical protein DEU56DRAFT_935653 [Suillus clintonianus]|uniref:uncharacterized protein n=1 Tax=Suillus clintonianus TaxID=1904413 RepID=UPI001B86CD56|nr:uncharacterized protein DEU56DRAFT_935653 [Suillus clintonianus]KAG2144565.1 hypothetical protein DEU56DRAFT_935653 [Suillus clintonianus]